jgi:hypothetical protein
MTEIGVFLTVVAVVAEMSVGNRLVRTLDHIVWKISVMIHNFTYKGAGLQVVTEMNKDELDLRRSFLLQDSLK